jgi:hypothetical protein
MPDEEGHQAQGQPIDIIEDHVSPSEESKDEEHPGRQGMVAIQELDSVTNNSEAQDH